MYIKFYKKHIFNRKELHTNNRGFALLYAMLVSSVLLTISFMIFSLTIKEMYLSSLGRESQYAFYYADSGLECALYYDLVQKAFNPSIPEGTSATIFCGDANRSVTFKDLGPIFGDNGYEIIGNKYERTFDINLPTELYCASVIVRKLSFIGGAVITRIESRGHNTCDNTKSLRVERALRAIY